MCGIVGIIMREGQVNPEILESMRDAMTHRGPDSSGLWIDKSHKVGLGHRRLSIVDLSSLGHQPMVDSETGCVLTFNGEIYNYQELRRILEGQGYKFAGHSDTEVLLAAYKQWGVICPQHLQGMFAFALWDPREQLLFLARDRAGEKPLYYKHDNMGFRFASELKGLMADPAFERCVDPNSLRTFLGLGYVPAPYTIFRGVCKLSPAQAITYRPSSNRFSSWRYWRVPSGVTGKVRSSFRSSDDYVDRLEQLLTDSVRRQLVADVPVGILLSGGIDSSLVTAMASRLSSKPVMTFTMKFPGFGRFDESKYAAQIARHFSTEHHELEAKPASLSLLPQLAAQFDEPMVDSSMIPTLLVSQMIRKHAKVALGGDGGDELFGGYFTYGRLEMLHNINKLAVLPVDLKLKMVALLIRYYGTNMRGRNYLPAFEAIMRGMLPEVRRLLLTSEIEDLLSPEYIRKAPTAHEFVGTDDEDFSRETFVYRLCRSDFSSYLVEDILTKVDRASMLTSLEVRAPWLDHKVIEFAFGYVPDSLKTNFHERKILPKLLAKKYFPTGYDFGRKQGFSLPLSAWFKRMGGNELQDLIRQNQLPIFAEAKTEALITGGIDGPSPEKVFGIALLGLWAKHYHVSF